MRGSVLFNLTTAEKDTFLLGSFSTPLRGDTLIESPFCPPSPFKAVPLGFDGVEVKSKVWIRHCALDNL